MASNLEKIKAMISNDKRLCERLALPIRIRYARMSDAAGREPKWSDFVWLDNIGGEGFGFTADISLANGEKLKIEMTIPCEPKPFIVGAQVVRIQEGHAGSFFYGLKIFLLQEGAKGKFEQFISDGIIDKYLDDQGLLKDIES